MHDLSYNFGNPHSLVFQRSRIALVLRIRVILRSLKNLCFFSKLNSKSCYYCTYTNVSKFYDAQQRLDKNCTKHTPFPFSIKPIRKQIPLYNSTCAVYFSISWVSKWTLTWIRSIWVFTNSMLMANKGRFDAFIYIYIRYFHNIFTSVKELKSHVIHNYKCYLR